MKLEDQVTNLELSKKLKELGVKQESYFYWFKKFTDRDDYFIEDWGKPEYLTVMALDFIKIDLACSAFTVAELGEMLPKRFDFKVWKDCWIITSKTPRSWSCCIENGEQNRPMVIESKTEANARAKMLIYLIENKLLKVD